MLIKDQVDQAFKDQTIDAKEIERFEQLAEEWWNPAGKFKVMHSFNNARCDYITTYLSKFFNVRNSDKISFTSLKILDVGCGGGLISEPLALMGANVVGVDATARNIEIAKRHASHTGAIVDYRHGTARTALDNTESFDAVLNLEVVEHVKEPKTLIKDCASFVRPGGLMIVATINRTIQSFLLAILGAEYVLRWLPRGTHHWKRFLKPDEISKMLSNNGLNTSDTKGVTLNPLTQKWKVSNDIAVNYLLFAKKPILRPIKG